jgi:malonyl-CoA/methylmalonyl-CoA synthetase
MSNFVERLLPPEKPGGDAQVALELPSGLAWTYADLARRSAAFAALLVERGVQPGHRVVVQVEKSPDAVALYLGVLSAGAVFVPLNTAYTWAEVDYFVRDAAARLMVCTPQSHDGLASSLRTAEVELLTLSTNSWGEVRAADQARCDAAIDSGCLAGAVEPGNQRVARRDQDLAAIVYTSGTTGRSKGAMLTHANLCSNAETLQEIWQVGPSDVLVHALPIFHVHGLFVALHTLFLARGRVRFLPRFDAETVREGLRGATVLMGVPTFYTRLLELSAFGAEDCSSMRLFISGSAPLLASTHQEFEQRTGHRVLERYGMSETGMITSNPLRGERIAGTVGYALPGVEVRVCERESGAVCAEGEVGEVEVRGPNVFAGYWGQPEKTAAEHRSDGFFRTGDLGSLDTQGRLTLVGRDKDLVISGGYNIYPKEVEEVLDSVAGVLESAVVGVPHGDLGEGVVAVLVAADDAPEQAEIQAALDQRLARFKHPRRFFWLDELPRNAMGKVQKKVLRERFAGSYSS